MEKIYRIPPTYPMNSINADFIMNPEPPTLFALMNSIANYGKENYTKIRDLAEVTRGRIFDFDYELSAKVDKAEFERDILNHFIMRRIGFETLTAFQIYLENKLHEILPYYNILFDSLKDFNLFNSGEVISRETIDNRNISGSANSHSESRYSEYPLDELSDLQDGKYVSNQTVNEGNGTNLTNDNDIVNEQIRRSPVDKMSLYKSYLETNKAKIMTMIYKDLDVLFYGLCD